MLWWSRCVRRKGLDLWGRFVRKEDMYVRDGLHLSGKGAAVFSENLLQSTDSGTGCNYLN